MKIRPLNDRIIVAAGRGAQDRFRHRDPRHRCREARPGEVLAVGNGRCWTTQIRPLQLKVGDKVLFGKYSGQTVKVQGEEVLVMREEDVMGVIE